MKRIAMLALAAAVAASIAVAPAAAAKVKTKQSSSSSSSSVKTKVSKESLRQDGYNAGYIIKICAANVMPKVYPQNCTTQAMKDVFAEGFKAGFAQHAYDEGVKAAKAQKTSRDWKALPPYKDCESASKKWFDGYKSINAVAAAGYQAGYDAHAKAEDTCTVPTEHSANAAIYKSFYKEGHTKAREIYLNYVKRYKEGYASTQTVQPKRRGDGSHRGDDPNRDWYEILRDETLSLNNQFYYIEGEFYYANNDGFYDGCHDRQAKKPSKF